MADDDRKNRDSDPPRQLELPEDLEYDAPPPSGRFELPEDFDQQVADLGPINQIPDPPVPDTPVPDPSVVDPPITHGEVFRDEWEINAPSAGSARGSPSVEGPPMGLLVRLAGHLLFSLAGLVIGYYVLCWIEPRANFLNLQLPGIEAPPPQRLR